VFASISLAVSSFPDPEFQMLRHWVVVVWLCVCWADATAQLADTAQTAAMRAPLQHGQRAYANGQYAKALKSFNQALALNPHCFAVWVALGDVHLRMQNTAVAHTYYGNALAADSAAPWAPDAFVGRAHCAYEWGDTLAALADYRSALQRAPRHLLAAEGYGTVLLALGQATEATSSFTVALHAATQPADSIRLLKARGLSHQRTGKAAEAIADYQHVLAADPETNQPLWLEVVECRLLIRDYQGAVTDATQALRTPDLAWRAYYLRGQAYLHLGELPRACTDLRKARDLGVGEAAELVRVQCE
jgi:tetratricopeptide (TPR) repeat protein